MTLNNRINDFSLSSLSAQNYQSASYSSWAAVGPNAFNWAIQGRVGDLTGTGNLKVFLDGSLDDPAVSSAVNLVSYAALTFTATSAVQTLIGSSPPLLPYLRIAARCEAAGAGTTDFKNVVVKLLSE